MQSSPRNSGSLQSSSPRLYGTRSPRLVIDASGINTRELIILINDEGLHSSHKLNLDYDIDTGDLRLYVKPKNVNSVDPEYKFGIDFPDNFRPFKFIDLYKNCKLYVYDNSLLANKVYVDLYGGAEIFWESSGDYGDIKEYRRYEDKMYFQNLKTKLSRLESEAIDEENSDDKPYMKYLGNSEKNYIQSLEKEVEDLTEEKRSLEKQLALLERTSE